MNYSKIQKIVSGFLLFSFFFGQIIGISIFSLFSNVYAENRAFSSIVSVIVNKQVYDELDSKIERYAEDIQNTLENTRVVILPVKKDTTAFQIASMNESLFTKGYKSLEDVDFESRLVGTVLIGSLPLPIVRENGKTTKSIVPFVDFEDKKFIYDHDTKIFEKNRENKDGLKAEIFHGVISPNNGDKNKDIEQIEDFLDKDHDFYIGENNFSLEKNVLNGKRGESIGKNYKPYIFYFDEIREQKSINYPAFKGYEAYMNNIEDINYNRYSKELAKKIKEEVLGAQNNELQDIVGKIDDNEIKKAFKDLKGPNLDKSTDIMAKQVVEGATNNFLEVFNKGSISDFRTNVHNAGRYNDGVSGVNVDLIPYFVSVLDLISAKVIKSANTDLEKQIDDLVKTSLSRNIAIPEKIVDNNYYNGTININTCSDEYLNFLNGKQVKNINSAEDCSIFRGSTYNSGTLVEANRGYNIKLIQDDVALCNGSNPKGYYGGASPFNLNKADLSNANFNLGFYDTSLAIKDTFDILGSKKVTNTSKTPSPLNCLENNFLFSIQRDNYWNGGAGSCNNSYILPIPDNSGLSSSYSSNKWLCSKNNKKYIYSNNYIIDFKRQKSISEIFNCGSEKITELDSSNLVFKEYETEEDYSTLTGIGCIKSDLIRTISYKKIPSFLEHKSPTIEEINEELKSQITPNLGIDKDRYIDFISAKGNYKKINYPYLFRVSGKNEAEIKIKLDKYLENKSKEINNLINLENPNSLSPKDKEIYEVLKVGDYNTDNFDLVGFLKNKPLKDITIDGETKSVSYYDFLVFSIYWNTLSNTSAKYKFVFENYLSDQVGGNNFNYILAKNKKQYEIAYLGAHGDSQNMYIKMDPKVKTANPYSDILSKNSLFNTNKISIGVLNGGSNIGNNEIGFFKCAPPEGVPIWKWFPAVQCWLENMLPPKISIGEGSCGYSEVFESEEDYFHLKEEQKVCKNDLNKNGINDCVENKLKNNGVLKLTSSNSRYFFNKRGNLKTEILDKNGKRIMLDNSSYVSFDLKKIVDKQTGKTVFDRKTDKFTTSLDIINKYLFFKPFSLRSSYGTTNYSFSLKNKEADIYFTASLDLKNYDGEKVIGIKSNDLIVKVRNERLFLGTLKIDENKQKEFSKSVNVNDKTNIYLYDKKNTNLDTTLINENSLVFDLSNIGKNNSKRNLNFPIKITLKDSTGKIIEEEIVNKLRGIKSLYKIKKSGNYTLEIKDKYKYFVSSDFSVLADIPSKVVTNLGTTILENKGSISTNVVSIYDRFDNIVDGEIYDFDLSILGSSVVFEENNIKKLKQTTFEGFKAFRLKSTDNLGISKIKIDIYFEGEKILSSDENIRVIDGVKVKTKFSNILKVGNKKYSVSLEFNDNSGKLLSDLNSRVYLSANSNYLKSEKDYVDVKNGKAEIIFYTNTTAKKDVEIKFRVEGFKNSIVKYITIFPEKPMNIELISSKNKLEASPLSENYIKVELKDIYNNVVFTDSSSSISMEILDEYKTIIDGNVFKQKLNSGVTTFKVNATPLPGAAYLKFEIDQKLEDNLFIVGNSPKEIKINGVSENAMKLETFYFYKKENIVGKKYNALYTTLLGASYGDITQKDYLAGAMLFDKNNRSLAVTSLLNNPYNFKDSLTIGDNGIISKVYDSSDLSQDLSIKLIRDLNNRYYLDLFNMALNTYIGKIYLNFDDLNISEDTFKLISESKDIDLKKIFNIEKINILKAKNKTDLNNLLESKKDSLIISLETSVYNIHNVYGKDNNSKAIFYNDPFTTEFSLNSFSRSNLDTYENFIKSPGLGWKAGNKTLLSFAAGENVGESTKDYMGVGTINLGDPIIYLKKIKKKSNSITKKFDSTIGKKLNKNEIKGYKTFDYNADSRTDILLLENNGFLSLLENKSIDSKFLDQKHLARIIDLGNTNLINTGDFSGDKYEDIFFVNNKGNPFLLNNVQKDFVRVDLTKNFDLKGKIVQAKAFDMNNDKITDIVTLDSSGEINIFYGKTGTSDFEKNAIYSGYGIKLNGNIRNDMGALYFDGLISEIEKKNNPKSAEDIVPVDMLENLMFEKIAYDPEIDDTKENHKKQTSFIKSEFASEMGLKVKKKFKDINGGVLQGGDIIEVKLILKNINNSKVLKNIVYLENIPKYFDLDLKSIKTNKEVIVKTGLGKYKFMIDKFKLNPKSELEITYKLKTKDLKYGYIKVGLFEQEEAGDDKYGDIIVSASKYNCGGDSDIFRSINVKSYEKGIKYEKCDESALPEKLAKNDIDTNENGIPDYIDELKDTSDTTKLQKYSNNALNEYNKSLEKEEDTNIFDDLDNLNNKVDNISADIDNLIEGFGCGFGGGSCFGMPVNMAPLAPGNDLVVLGKLVGDGLKVNEGLPVFSALTGINIPTPGGGCYQIPAVWPISPFKFAGICNTSIEAGGYMGVDSPTNFFRLFVTPTLTGGVGMAACFGGPASAIGNLPPKGINPVVSGGNCIVAAAPLPSLCEDEEITSDPGSIGQVDYFGGVDGGAGFGVINGNCSARNGNKKLPISNKIDTNLARAYLDYRKTGKVSSNLKNSFSNAFKNPAKPGSSNSYSLNEPLVSINGGLGGDSDVGVSLDFSDNSEGINFKAVEELTQDRVAGFPSFITNWVSEQLEEFVTKLTDFPTLFVILPDFSSISNADWGEYAEFLESGVSKAYNSGNNNDKKLFSKQTSGIKEAYDFLGNVPFVSVEGAPVNINIPWIDEATWDATKTQRSLAIDGYKKEIELAKDRWSYGVSCDNKENEQDRQECLDDNKAGERILLNTSKFVKSLETNLQVLETYKEIPEKLASLANKKQDYLEQILCNVDNIQEVTTSWLDRNGKRFKSWVELYMLIKAILKSWQLLADLFIDYDAECHECKNERHDSIGVQFELVSMIIPKIPIIKFPKWPDIVLDLHNIRLNLAIELPEFNFNKRPLILPPVPRFKLPDSPGAGLSLPSLSILPNIEIPELPDLPSLPEVKLPDLPPPPKLPKLFASIEGVLNVLKLITKAMCILKKSPFVPESRAGDQIAFLTEGSGYRPFDFIDMIMPQFSYPFVDEIKVTSFVNLEFEAEFIIEMAKTIAQPINETSNNFSHMFDKTLIKDIDLSESVDIKDIDIEGKDFNKTAFISNKEFLGLVNKDLSKENLIKDSNLDEIRKTFDVVNNYTYSKENRLISDLKKTNFEKFDILKSIIKREIKKSKDLKKQLKDIEHNSIYKTISNDVIDDIKIYNTSLEKYNKAFKKSTKSLFNPNYINTNELKEQGKDVLEDFKNNTKYVYKNDEYIAKNSKLETKINVNSNKNYFALNATNQASTSTCKAKTSQYKRKYEGIYIIQKENSKKVSYKLFDYLDDLSGDEVIKEIDFDLDSDSDLLYSMDGNLYLKENLIKNKTDKVYYNNSITLDSDSNKYLNGDVFYESPNNVSESLVSDNFININFSSLRKNDISNYRLEYYNRIDKYLNEGHNLYNPKLIRKNIVDGFSNSDEKTIYYNTGGIIKRNNLAYIYDIGNNISGVTLKTKKLLDLSESIKTSNIANISAGTRIYAGNKTVEITYLDINGKNRNELKINPNTNVELEKSIKIIGISGSVYVINSEDIILEGQEIYNYLGKPLSFDSKIELSKEFNTSISSHIGIEYYDSSRANLDFREIKSYKLYNLGLKADNYSINLSVKNDYLYSNLEGFKNNIFGTKTSQVLLSPQKQADKYAPEINFNSKIRIPVYIEKIIDLTDFIYENSGIENISSLSIEGIDENKYKVLKTENKLRVKFGKFNNIFEKKVKFIVTDTNNNISTKDIEFEVYTPIPEINLYKNNIISGVIDESLTGEPINIYRYRGGVIKRLESSNGSTKVNTKTGEFDFDIKTISSDLIDISYNGVKVFNINEKTGKITLSNPLYETKVEINKKHFIEISVFTPEGYKIFTQSIKGKQEGTNIYVTNDFDNLKEDGIYFKLINSDFNYYKLPSIVKYNPGSLAIYRKSDINKTPLFAILKDSRIKLLNNNFYKIDYSSNGDYIVLKFIDKHFNKIIGELLFKIDNSYVIN